MMIRVFVLTSLFFGSQVQGNPNACDDYLARHYKKDLVPLTIRYVDREYVGDIRYPHQLVSVSLKNRGEVDFSGTGTKRMTVRIAGVNRVIQIPASVASGQSIIGRFYLPPNSLKHCKNSEIHIDTLHDIGQWGCQVWNNDRQTLLVRKQGQFCRVIPKPRTFAIRPIRR